MSLYCSCGVIQVSNLSCNGNINTTFLAKISTIASYRQEVQELLGGNNQFFFPETKERLM